MATYIQGQQDYITQVQPTAPNLQFDAQILGLKQSKYDANHKKVSDLYGSLLNSDMTRTENNLARNEFFKIINSDIKKMGSFDFSLDANVTAAASIFESIYTNQNIVKDMVWTKNYNNEVTRMDGFKNCLDEEKCGGTYWEQGEKYMNYKRKEFETASTGQALNTEDVRFIPNKSVMKEAIKLAKAADLNVTVDQKNGDYIVRTKNGELITAPLTTLFKNTIGSNPAFADKFLAEAYVDRNDWVYNKVAMGEFSTVEEAQMGYLTKKQADNTAQLKKTAAALNQDLATLNNSVAYYKKEYESGQFKEGSELYNKYAGLVELQQNAQAAANYTQNLRQIAAASNKNAAMDVLLNNADQQTAYNNLNIELSDAVSTLAFKDYESTMTADEFSVLKHKFTYDSSLKKQQHGYDLDRDRKNHLDDMDKIKKQHAYKLEEIKQTAKTKTEEKRKSLLVAKNNYADDKDKYTLVYSNAEEFLKAKWKLLHREEMPSDNAIRGSDDFKKKKAELLALREKYMINDRIDLNRLAYTAEENIPYPLELSESEINELSINDDGDTDETKVENYLATQAKIIAKYYKNGEKDITEADAYDELLKTYNGASDPTFKIGRETIVKQKYKRK